MTILCTTIIPTVGRTTLARAVRSALDQDLGPDQHQIIVVNDSGQPLPAEAWQQSPQIEILSTNRCERSVARNVGVAVALGKYLHFLDDDDNLLPGGLPTLLKVAEISGCSRVYGGYQIVNPATGVTQVISPHIRGDILAYLVAGETMPWGASLLQRQLFYQLDGFDTTLSVREDYDLECRAALHGEVACTQKVVACFRVGTSVSTTDWSRLAYVTHRIRERVFLSPHALPRILAGAREAPYCYVRQAPYLYEKLGRAYLGALLFGLSQKRLDLIRLHYAQFLFTCLFYSGLHRFGAGLSPSSG